MLETEKKINQLRVFLNQHGYEGILLFRRDMFSWVTGGRINHIIHATEYGMVTLFITKDNQYCISNQVEKIRMMEEEELVSLGYTFLDINWWEEDYVECVYRQFGEIAFAADRDLPGIPNVFNLVKRLRYSLMPEEIKRYREVCGACTEIVENICKELKPGDTEQIVCGRMIGRAAEQGIEASVALVASDERIFRYRHPIDTKKRISQYALVVLCGRKYGLYANLTRFVHFGAMPKEITDKFRHVWNIEAEMFSRTVAGTQIKDIFQAAVAAYGAAGYPDEWHLLHQGGPTGYDTREFIAGPNDNETVLLNQAYTWNPSIAGAKSEDTILVTEQGVEVLTRPKDWPVVETKANRGQVYVRPDVLVR